MGIVARELAWLLDEAVRQNLDASGGDFHRVEDWVRFMADEVAKEVLRKLDERQKAATESVPVLPLPFDPWEHLRPPTDGTEPR